MGVEPLVDFLPGRLGECRVHPAHNLVHQFGAFLLFFFLSAAMKVWLLSLGADRPPLGVVRLHDV